MIILACDLKKLYNGRYGYVAADSGSSGRRYSTGFAVACRSLGR